MNNSLLKSGCTALIGVAVFVGFDVAAIMVMDAMFVSAVITRR